MSVTFMGYVWASDTTPTETLVLLAIADFINDMGDGCWASYDRLAYKTKLSRRTVIYTVNSLEKKGYLTFQKKHKDYRTNVWTLNNDIIPKLPPFNEWLKATRKKEFEPETEEIVGAAVAPTPKPGVQQLHLQGAAVAPTWVQLTDSVSAAGAPNPLVREPLEYVTLPTAVPAEVSAPVSSNSAHHDKDDEWSDLPINERPSIDDQITRGDDDLDDRAKMRPKTELEKKIVQLCNSSYITDNQRRHLSESVFAAQGKQRPQNYPSPEAEWKENPDRFNEYVEDCARIQRNNTGRPPGRDALIGLIRNYARHKTGWLDFKDFKEVEAAPAKQAEGKYYENRPKRLVFGEKARF